MCTSSPDMFNTRRPRIRATEGRPCATPVSDGRLAYAMSPRAPPMMVAEKRHAALMTFVPRGDQWAGPAARSRTAKASRPHLNPPVGSASGRASVHESCPRRAQKQGKPGADPWRMRKNSRFPALTGPALSHTPCLFDMEPISADASFWRVLGAAAECHHCSTSA